MQFKKYHQAINFFLKIFLQSKSYLAAFYIAQLEFFYANYGVANKFIDIFLAKYPRCPDATYLKVQILFLMGSSKEAIALLLGLLKYSPREKTLIILSKMVENKHDFQKILQIYREKYDISSITLKAWDYIMDIAIKVEEYEIAKNYYQKKILDKEAMPQKSNKKKKFFRAYEAQVALEDLSRIFERINIKMFLVSGTFLGCIRNKSILSHDYDIDVGVFEEDMNCKVLENILKEGVFYQHEFNKKGIIKLKHINGIMIDIFIHYRDGDITYHLGAKNRWNNAAFKLQKYKFLDGEYYGALDYELYLSENYGNDWRVPKKDFNSILDTPNIEIIDRQGYIVYLCRLLNNGGYSNKSKIIAELEKYGEQEFVEKYQEIKLEC
ncbi:tetratricopeptide repeat protein [Helicobacter colisuis]|uniref:LicD family protein n=1 Tax=Helicobacter colisuis TaxID=2949739 RepID=A0ABT0TV65_9HELI|nr:hypothetical protein [Helicobacter colisuis]MCL9819805.1 hypothetical protein [Helicobacter colisuis]